MPPPHRWRILAGILLTLVGAPPSALAQSSQDDLPVTRGVPKFTPPVLVEKVEAEYPKEAADAGIEGTVILEFNVDDKGVVKDVTVKESAGHGFDDAAVAAVKQFKFKPGLNDLTPVPSRITYSYRFAIKKVLVQKPIESPTGEAPVRIQGRVLARGTRAPIAGAAVQAVLQGDASVAAAGKAFDVETDKDGGFALRGLPPGAWQLTVTGNGLVRTTFREKLDEKTVVTVRYYVDRTWAARYETTVRVTAEREEVSRQTLTGEELQKIPGSFGDAIRAVENMPGVARAPFNIGLLIVRGGKPTDSRAYFAGSEVPQLYHFGGLTSVVPTHLVEKVDYYPGNFPSRFGRAIAGSIDVDLREGKRDRVHGYINTNAFDAGASVEGPVGKGSFIVAARRSYIDGLLGLGASVGGLNGVPLSFVTAPVYWDYQALLDYPVGGGKLRVMLFGSDDVLKLLFDSPQGDPSIRGSFRTHIYFHRLQTRWVKQIGPVQIYLQNSSGYGGSEAELGSDLNFTVGSITSDTRLEARWKISKRFKIVSGLDLQYAYVNLTAKVPIPLREGELMLPLSAATKYRADEKYHLFNFGYYAEATLQLHDRFTLTPGIRFDTYSGIKSWSFNPRLGARLKVTDITVVKAGVGLFSQDPQPQDYDATFGNPNLRPENAVHLALSLEQGIIPGLQFEATGFYKHLYGLVASSSRSVQRDGAIVAERVSSTGEGRVYGGEFLLRQSLSKWFFGWISYTLMRSERRDCPGCSYRLFDFDQTHIFVVALHVNLPYGFELGGRFRYVSGYPYTLVSGGHFDADGDVYVAGKFPINNARYNGFNQLDLRIDKTFVFKRWTLKIYLDVTNVYNNPNQEQVQYSYDYKAKAFIRGLPIIPSFGVTGQF